MSKQHFASIDDIVDYYVVPALGMYADDFNVRDIVRFFDTERDCTDEYQGQESL